MSSDALLPAADGPALAGARERAIRLLTDRYADDTLSSGEFESRLDRLYGTRTPADAAALVADLERPAMRQVPERPPARPAPLAGSGDDRTLCVFAERTFGGRWSPGARTEIVAAFAEVTIDLREASLGPVTEFEITAAFASVRVLLPPGAVLDANVSKVMGEVHDRVPPAVGQGPHVRLRGLSALAEVSVRRAPTALPADAPFRLVGKEAGRAAKRARRS